MPLALAAVGWSIAGLLCWFLVSRVGWLGIALIGITILFVASRAALDEDNASSNVPGGIDAVYRAAYDRQFGYATAEEAAAVVARRQELDRFLYVARTIGLAMLALGANMFIIHQL
jgi:hypothetical protein